MNEEKISYIKLPNITVSKLQDIVDFLDDNEIEYVEYYEEDLQNRIDKAIEYINDLYFDFYDYECDQLIVGKHMVNDLLDILKESDK